MKPKVSKMFSEDEAELIMNEALRTEKKGQWTAPLFTLAEDKRLFHLLVPRKYGGQQTSLPEFMKWIEAASWLDGSFGWNLTLGAGAGIFSAYLNSELAEEVFSQDQLFISGSGFPGGEAERNGDDSFILNGEWKYVSGIREASLITVNCFISENGERILKNGQPVIKAAACRPEKVSITSPWKSMGLKGTDTHDISIKNIKVPHNHIFEISPEHATINGALYHYPFEPFAVSTLAISLIGMGARFLREAKNKLQNNDREDSSGSLSEQKATILNNCIGTFNKSRQIFLESIESSWNTLQKDEKLPKPDIAKVNSISRNTCEKVLECVQRVYPLLGMSAINPETDVNRCWRDLHTASQHSLLSPTPKNKKGDLV